MSLQRSAERFPIWVHKELDDLGLDPFVLSVYVHLSRRANGTGKAWPKRETIAAHCGISERQVTRCIQVLEAECLIVVVRENNCPEGGRRNSYYLTNTDEWLLKAAKNQASQGDCVAPSNGAKVTETSRQGDCVAPSLIEEGKPIEGKPIIGFQVPSKLPKGKKTKHVDPKQLLATFPEQFRQDDDFVEAFTNWAADRIDKKNPLTDRGCAIARNKLIKFPVVIAIKALERATEAGWSGVFPESIGKGGKSDKFEAASSDQPANDWFGS